MAGSLRCRRRVEAFKGEDAKRRAPDSHRRQANIGEAPLVAAVSTLIANAEGVQPSELADGDERRVAQPIEVSDVEKL